MFIFSLKHKVNFVMLAARRIGVLVAHHVGLIHALTKTFPQRVVFHEIDVDSEKWKHVINDPKEKDVGKKQILL